MALSAILLFCLAALIGRWLLPRRALGGYVLAVSLLAIFALQTSSPIRELDFWLPLAAIGLTVLTWAIITYAPEASTPSPTARPLARAGVLIIVTLTLLLAVTRYVPAVCCLTATTPPALLPVLAALLLAAGLAWLPWRFAALRRPLAAGLIVFLIAALVVLKTPALAVWASAGLRQLSGQAPHLAAAIDLPWLGFSYLAFRLIHVLREYQAGKLPTPTPYSLAEFAAYALFFATYTAGPIDRAPRWINDLRTQGAATAALDDTITGGWRILLGLFKKFALADSLALIALSPHNALQINTTAGAWLLLLAYSLRIYADFSGYSDIALGLGRILGLRLPENFDRPYTRPNLTAFWNAWHITLAQWFRAYYFNPLTRWLRSRPAKLPVWSIILIAQFSTMILIGLWHGVSLNFLIWGAWHGLGLFIHSRYAEWAKPYLPALEARPRLAQAARLSGWLITFLYVALGWVWFALPDTIQALAVFARLLGVR